MKMTLSKLIANDIINYGMSQTSGFDYSVFLESYIDDFDLEGKNYIYNNLEEICDAISKNENISYFNYNKETKEFDMVFYWNNLMNDTEKYVYEILLFFLCLLLFFVIILLAIIQNLFHFLFLLHFFLLYICLLKDFG